MMRKLISFFGVLGFACLGMECRLPENASRRETAAAEFLKKEALAVAPESKTQFEIITDDAMPDEAWQISGNGKVVTLKSGKYGHFFAIAHYLRDVCGVKYLTPEETVAPEDGRGLPNEFETLSGDFQFEVRDINNVSDVDFGRFATLNCMNGNGGSGCAYSEGGSSIRFENGGRSWFGSPWIIHTTGDYLQPSRYFDEHPDWYAEIDGKRMKGRTTGHSSTQLCLSNPEMRTQFLVRLKESIVRASKSAQEKGVDVPLCYSIDQNDNQNYCRCAKCTAMAEKYGGAQSGVMLDFANEMGNAIADEFPDVKLYVDAYQYTEKPPVGIKPAKNVVVVLCDTLSNVLQPIDSTQNSYFNSILKQWSQISHTLRVWDYNITFQPPCDMPYNSEWTYQSDLQLFKKNNVKQLFTEFEEPVFSDVRDYKILVKMALTENPQADYDKLTRKIARDLYGDAAEIFLEYRERLRWSQNAHGTGLGMYPNANSFTHLDLDTVKDSQKLFDIGLEILANDPKSLARWKRARISLDRATIVRSRNFMQEYKRRNGSLKGYPFDREAIAARLREEVVALVPLRVHEKNRDKVIAAFDAELKKYLLPIPEASLELPEQFRQYPQEDVYDYNMENTMRWRDIAKMVDDPESDLGRVARLEFPNTVEEATIDKYQFPITFGIYSESIQKTLWFGNLNKGMVKEPGYHWYKIGATPLSGDALMYFFWGWSIKLGVGDAYNMNEPDKKYDMWVRVKFTGPSFPCGKEGEQDAIWFERVILVKNK